MTYKEKYYEIINSGYKTKPENVYTEKHHIIPRSVCILLDKSQKNLIYLTAKNHFLAHYYIWKWFKEELHEKKWARKMCFALHRMKRQLMISNDIEKLSDLYDEVRREFSKDQSERMKGNKSPFYGKHHSEETRKKLSEANKGEKNSNFGKPMPYERKAKLSKNNGSHRQEVRDKISKTRIERRCGIGNKNAVCGKGHKGLKWITNGIIEKTIPIGENPPEGFRFGRCYNKYGKKENA